MTCTSDLAKLARKLCLEGPHKVEQTPRRVRGLFNGKYAFDTIGAYHVWEHPNYPQFYVPTSAFTREARVDKIEAIQGTDGAAHLGRLSVGSRSTTRVLVFNTPGLKDIVKVDFNAIEQWFEEDVPIYCHPKDPYKRIDILHSTRNVRITLDNVTLAESSRPVLLLETTLRTRYYLPPTSVNWEHLSPSTTETLCPYKGRANYHHVNVNSNEYRDLAWYYRYPTMESAPIAGYVCFYNEKVDVWIDGVKEAR